MAIDRSFNNMINEYLSYDLLTNEYMARDWFLKNIEKDNDWTGGDLPVPFEEAAASSIVYGALESDSDIGEAQVVRGTVSGQKFVSASMVLNHRDLIEHSGSDKISKKSFLKILPGQVDGHMKLLKEIVSSNLLNGKKLCKLTANATNVGTAVVDRPERLKVGMKVEFNDTVPTASETAYVKEINLATKTVTFVTARGGAVLSDLSEWDLANGAYICMPGANSDAFSGLKDMLLSAANGGSSSLYGKSKATYTYLQSHNEDGSAITSSAILGKIFDAYSNTRRFYSGDPRKVIMSYKNFGTAMKELQASKGAYSVVPNSQKATAYFNEAQIYGIAGGVLDLVGVQELDDDVIIGMDLSAVKFHSNGFIRRIKSPDGLEYFTKRATTGYKYILDHEIFGELVLSAPQKCFIIHSISY